MVVVLNLIQEDFTMSNPTQNPSDFSQFLDSQDDFDRLMAQSKALLTALLSDDSYKDLDATVIGNLLWLIDDRLSGVRAANNQIVTYANLQLNSQKVAL